jgi:hypothetical protein
MSSSRKSAFQVALERYLDELRNKPKSKRADFIREISMRDGQVTAEEIQTSIHRLEQKCTNTRVRKVTTRVLTPVIDGLNDYSGVIDTMVQAYPLPLALIWGSLKIVIDCAGRFVNLFETIRTEMLQLADQISRIAEYEKLYASSAFVQKILCDSYVNILRFWYQVYKGCRQSAFRQLMSATVSNTKLAKILNQLKLDGDSVEKAARLAAAQLQDTSRAEIREEAVEAAFERIAHAIERKKQEAFRQEDEIHKTSEWRRYLYSELG